jgi:hypothetical protein
MGIKLLFIDHDLIAVALEARYLFTGDGNYCGMVAVPLSSGYGSCWPMDEGTDSKLDFSNWRETTLFGLSQIFTIFKIALNPH